MRPFGAFPFWQRPDPIPVWVEGCPPELIRRAEDALAWCKAALAISEETPEDAPDYYLAAANLQAACTEVRNAQALLNEFRSEDP